MSTEHFLIGVLVSLLLAQNIFWAKVCLNLTNRLMSRSYAEFSQYSQKPTITPPPKMEEGYDPVAEHQAKELNSLLGMV